MRSFFFFYVIHCTHPQHRSPVPSPAGGSPVSKHGNGGEGKKKTERKKLISKEPFLLFPDTRYATGHQSNADNNITRQPCQDIY